MRRNQRMLCFDVLAGVGGFTTFCSPKLVSMNFQDTFRKVMVPICMRFPPCATCFFASQQRRTRRNFGAKACQIAVPGAEKEREEGTHGTGRKCHMAFADQLGVCWAAAVPQALLTNDWYKCLTKLEANACFWLSVHAK